LEEASAWTIQRRPRDLRSPKVAAWSDHRSHPFAITGWAFAMTGFGVRHAPVSAFAMVRNPHSSHTMQM